MKNCYDWNRDEWNKIHDKISIISYEWYYNKVREILEKDLYSKKIIDLGIGKGRLYGNLNNINLIGVDFSDVALKFAKKCYHEGVYILSDIESFNTDKYVDLVILMGVLSLNNDEKDKKILEIAKKIIKEDGKIFLSIYREKNNKQSLPFEYFDFIEKNNDCFYFTFLNKKGELYGY
jgi:2-polyprenyl-3-methyl-5-hydroxy-6-metoxy-1,4-benzoquinol methylase